MSTPTVMVFPAVEPAPDEPADPAVSVVAVVPLDDLDTLLQPAASNRTAAAAATATAFFLECRYVSP